MKKLRCLASMLAIIMVIMTCNTGAVYAYETQPQAKITVSSDTAATGIVLKDKTFNAYKVLDAKIIKATTAGAEDSIEYTVTEAYKNFFIGKTTSEGVTIADDASLNHDVQVYINDQKDNMPALVAAVREYTIDNSIAVAATTGTVTTTNKVDVVSTDLLNPGYYMVLDSADTGKVPSGTAAMQGALVTLPSRNDNGTLSKDVTINIKASVPTIEKDIWHNDLANSNGDNSLVEGNKGSWDTVGDYQIGDTVEFLITAKLPTLETVLGYDNYEYMISDTMSEGLELNGDSIAIYLDRTLKSDPVPGTLSTTTVTGNTFTIDGFDIEKIYEGHPSLKETREFYVYYTATVTKDAKLALDKETNTVKLEYSNNPYDKESKGEVEDTVYSYTFELNVAKTKGDGHTGLEGAVFALYEVIEGDTVTYKQISLAEKTEVTADGAVVYYPVKGGAASDDVSDGGNGTGTIVTREEGGVIGKFHIVGLDDATEYRLVEIKAPTGYNPAEPIDFKINAEYAKDPVTGIPTPTVTVSGDIKDKDVTVVNTSSTLLPETGGMGTTMFMVIGQVLMGLALIAFIIRRKAVLR